MKALPENLVPCIVGAVAAAGIMLAVMIGGTTPIRISGPQAIQQEAEQRPSVVVVVILAAPRNAERENVARSDEPKGIAL